jgi:cysteine desulfurase
MKLPIYMDHHATTPVDPRVLESMLPYFTEIYGNAASIDHEYGHMAKNAVDTEREQIASVINAQAEEIVFTSGATEADNLAILGVAQQYREKGNHIITCVTEHKAVLDTCKYLESQGWKITYLPVDQQGLISLDDVRKAITPNTVLISVMAANNEIGVLAPIAEIGRIAHEYEVLFHTDATQAVGYVPIDVRAMNIDLLSMSGHKIYGPKGIGALYVRNRRPRVKLTEQMHGGGHERNMRSGTLNVPGIIGFGEALNISRKERSAESSRLLHLRNLLWEGLQDSIKGIQLNGHPVNRLPNNLNVAIPSIESQSLVVQLKNELAISTGSACTTAIVEPSHVIMALGFGSQRAHNSVRFGLGKDNTISDVKYVLDIIPTTVNRIKQLI